MKRHGHYCKVCGECKANEKFSGKGHIGLGGILTGRDALEFIMAGAAAVQVGTANFLDPKACTRITAEIGEWMDAHGVKTLDEIRGCARG